MKSQFLTLMMILVIIMGAQAASGEILNVPHDFSSIKEALFHSERGDNIQISPGMYYEIDLFVPPGVTLTGMGERPDQVVIDAEAMGRIMLCESLDETTIIQNITFTNGLATGPSTYDQSGGAILMNNSTLRLVNCHFINNTAEGQGGALRCSHSSPQILNCHFEGNSAPEGGGGAIDCSYFSSPLVQSCFFKMNQANWGGALSCRGDSSPLVYNSIFHSNEASGNLGYGGGVIADFGALPIFEQCTFFENQARYGGALACFETSQTNLKACTLVGNSSLWMGAGLICSNSFPVIENSIIAFQEGSAVACGGSALPSIRCTNIFGNDLGDWTGAIEAQFHLDDNLSVDPLFCDLIPENEIQFRLQGDSPCSDDNSPCSLMGAWPVGCEITPIYIDEFTAVWSDGVPRISWHAPYERFSSVFILLRSLASQPEDERPIPFMAHDGGDFIAYDSELQVEGGQELVYRLYLVQEDDTLDLISQARLSDSGMLKPLHLVGAYPNPFNPRTTIRFETSQERLVTITVHNIRGQQVRQLSSSRYPAGVHEVLWDGIDERGLRVESGTYFVTIGSDGMIRSQKILLLK